MNRTPDVELVLHEWLADDGDIAPDRVLEVVADRIAVQRQRRAWRLQRRLTVTPALKYGLAAAAVLVIAVAGYSLIPRGNLIGGPSPATSPALTPLPPSSASPAALPLREGPLSKGRYVFERYLRATVNITAEVPAGWQGWGGSPEDEVLPQTVVGPGELDPPRVSVVFQVADGLHRDPCHWNRSDSGDLWQGGGVVGPTAIELVNALQESSSYSSTTPKPVMVGGFEGYELEVRAPDDLNLEACDGGWITGTHYYVVFSGRGTFPFWFEKGNRMHLFIVDVLGTRVIATILYSDDTPSAEVEAARAIIDSVEFMP